MQKIWRWTSNPWQGKNNSSSNDVPVRRTTLVRTPLLLRQKNPHSLHWPVMMTHGSWLSQRNQQKKGKKNGVVHWKHLCRCNSGISDWVRIEKSRKPANPRCRSIQRTGFQERNGPGASARITISEKAHTTINKRTFWPSPAYVRLWNFQDKTSAVTEFTDSILVSGGTSTAAQLPSDKDGPVC